jgi:hypothetical protein
VASEAGVEQDVIVCPGTGFLAAFSKGKQTKPGRPRDLATASKRPFLTRSKSDEYPKRSDDA